jgi:hypothetical protein
VQTELAPGYLDVIHRATSAGRRPHDLKLEEA